MTKKNKTPLGIFAEAIGLYFSNFKQFVKYMSFPVLGQVVGLCLVFLCIYIYSKNMPYLIEKFSLFDNFVALILVAIFLTVPGMIIFMKAFWEYLVAYGALNSMLENMLSSGKVYDFDAHTELIKRRTVSYVGLWMLFCIFSAIAIVPFFWVIAGIFAVFFVLVFQVFTYEPELTPVGCVKKSLMLVKGHFASTFMLMALAGALTYCLIPQLFNMLFNSVNINNFLASVITPVIAELPVAELNKAISYAYLPPIKVEDIAMFVVATTVAQILIQYTLPLRSLLWGLWYKELNGSIPKQVEKKRKSTKKRPSEKLMEESHKKFSAKKLDRNILKRAMEKDDEEES